VTVLMINSVSCGFPLNSQLVHAV